MSSLCPICNGMQEARVVCPQCGERADDCGRFGDYYGPYSPYRPIDDIALTNGWADVARHLCVHLLACPSCGNRFHFFFREWKE